MLLTAALLLPLAFRSPTEVREGGAALSKTPAETRSALFLAFWYGAEDSPDGAAAVMEKVEKTEPDAVTSAYCEGRMAALTAQCIDDRSLADPTPTGSEYTTVTGKDGTEVHLCRMWLQARGDWQNWLDVCFDTDDGCIYYLYVSRERLTNGNLYTDRTGPNWAATADALAKSAGGKLRHFSENASGGTAVVDTGEGLLCYQITGAYFDALVDVRINCV